MASAGRAWSWSGRRPHLVQRDEVVAEGEQQRGRRRRARCAAATGDAEASTARRSPAADDRFGDRHLVRGHRIGRHLPSAAPVAAARARRGGGAAAGGAVIASATSSASVRSEPGPGRTEARQRRSRPSSSRVSNSGGPTVRPVTATRTGAWALATFRPCASATATTTALRSSAFQSTCSKAAATSSSTPAAHASLVALAKSSGTNGHGVEEVDVGRHLGQHLDPLLHERRHASRTSTKASGDSSPSHGRLASTNSSG